MNLRGTLVCKCRTSYLRSPSYLSRPGEPKNTAPAIKTPGRNSSSARVLKPKAPHSRTAKSVRRSIASAPGNLLQRQCVIGPGFPLANRSPVDLYHGISSAPVPVRKHSSAVYNRSYRVRSGSATGHPCWRASSMTTPRVMPCSAPADTGGVSKSAPGHDEDVVAGALGHKPLASSA
jgi:hypothetical protein